MSQKAVLVRVDGNLIPEVFHSVPDYDDMGQICIDNGFDGTEESYTDYYNVEYEWIEIGEGESGMDSFIDDETLLHIYDAYGYEDVINEYFNLDVEVIETGSEEVLFEDLEEDESCIW